MGACDSYSSVFPQEQIRVGVCGHFNSDLPRPEGDPGGLRSEEKDLKNATPNRRPNINLNLH